MKKVTVFYGEMWPFMSLKKVENVAEYTKKTKARLTEEEIDKINKAVDAYIEARDILITKIWDSQ